MQGGMARLPGAHGAAAPVQRHCPLSGGGVCCSWIGSASMFHCSLSHYLLPGGPSSLGPGFLYAFTPIKFKLQSHLA
eukprot:358989-Chlamydomonas_euryale.AAC.9